MNNHNLPTLFRYPRPFRHPPPPVPRHTSGGSLMDSVEIAGGIDWSLRRCSSEILTTMINYLPDEIVFDILIRLAAEDLYKSTMLVCRKWYRMIHTHNFIDAHLHNSAHGLLVQNLKDKNNATFVALRDGQIEISKFSYKFNQLFWCSCNGLMLDSYLIDVHKYEYNLFITNPATNQHFVLPQFFHRAPPHLASCLAYSAASMEYKVVRTYNVKDGFPISLQPELRCAILTVGVDNSWRHVPTQHLSSTAVDLLRNHPLGTEGFVHWARNGTHVVTLDIETETITQTPVPQCDGRIYDYYYFSGLSHLSLLIARGFFLFEVWEMKPETRQWTKLPNVDLRAQQGTFKQMCCEHDSSFTPDGGLACKLIPAGWLKYKEVLVFIVFKEVSSGFGQTWLRVAYNVRTHEIVYVFELEPNFRHYLVHKNSLLWLDRC